MLSTTGQTNRIALLTDATATGVKTFDGINNKARYGYKFSGENEDVMILNLNGIKTAFIVDGGHRHKEEDLQLAA
jgi:hypothetical protein